MKLVSPRVTCAYLYPITLHGYPPDVRETVNFIKQMADMGFVSLELEGIGSENIEYLFNDRLKIGQALQQYNCKLSVLCLVLPELGSYDADKRRIALECFEMGCRTAHALGASGVLDNGPLLPFNYPHHAPIQRHYSESYLKHLGLPTGFDWNDYQYELYQTFRKACDIAAKYQLKYHLHPCEGSLITTTDSFINFKREVDRANLFFNMDTANQFFFRDSLQWSLLRLADRISYIHLSDNRGNRVEHLRLGEGSIDWEQFFLTLKAVNYQGDYCIDVGGAESHIDNIQDAYRYSASWLEDQLKKYSLI